MQFGVFTSLADLEDNPDNVWIRDKEEFLSLVDKNKYPDVVQKERFEKISDN